MAQTGRSVIRYAPPPPIRTSGAHCICRIPCWASITRSLPLPSSVAPQRFAKGLRGDLDTIILKAMAKERERRYASVDELSEDIRRHLSGRPIVAEADNLAYRAGKFLT